MQYCFSGKTSDDVWQKAMTELLTGSPEVQESRSGKVLELSHISFTIDDPRQRWVHSRTPAINPAFAVAEVFAILGGSNDASFLNFWNPALPKYAGLGAVYYGAYGHRLRTSFGFDQIDRAYSVLKNNPTSRQVLLQIWDPVTDFPEENGDPRDADIPCNVCSLLKVRNGKLDWLQTMRSNDVYRGTPYNFVQFTTLQEIIAGWLNLDVGRYCHISDSLHFYESDLSELGRSIGNNDSPEYMNCDDLRLNKQDWDEVFATSFENMRILAKHDLSRKDYLQVVRQRNSPTAYKNLVLIAAADSARRRNWRDEMLEAEDCCKNNLLVLLWKNWEKRKRS
jgi:thymidylate synthase